MKFKLIAIDIDGTLLSPQGLVSARTKSAVQRALEAGYMVCFATGRNHTESISVLQAVEHFGKCVFVGGAMVVDTRTKVTLHRTLMHAQLAQELCRFFENRGQAALCMQDTGVSKVDYLISSHIEPSFSTRLWLDNTQATVHWADDLPTHSHEHTVRVGIVVDDEKSHGIHEELKETFGTRIVSHSLLIHSQGVRVVEVFDPAVNKWNGLMHIAGSHGILPEEIVAVGDDLNDLPMVRSAGLGVAMGNAHPELIAVASRVIKTNAEDGLAEFLEELVGTTQSD